MSTAVDWVDPSEISRTCTQCGRTLPLSKFQQRKADVHHPVAYHYRKCKDCCRTRADELRYSRRRHRNEYGENQKKLPPYEQLKAEFLAGASYSELALKYDCAKTVVHRTLRTRAMRRGEWPLIADAVRKHARPWQHIYTIDGRLIRSLVVDHCHEAGTTMRAVCGAAGLSRNYLAQAGTEGTPRMSVRAAIQLLEVIGEEVPGWMRQLLADREKAGVRVYGKSGPHADRRRSAH